MDNPNLEEMLNGAEELGPDGNPVVADNVERVIDAGNANLRGNNALAVVNNGTFLDFFDDKTEGNPLLGSGMVLTGNVSEDLYNNEIPNTMEGTVFLALAYTAASIPGVSVQFEDPNFQWNDLRMTVKFPKRFEGEYAQREGAAENIRDLVRGDTSRAGEFPDWYPEGNNLSSDDFGMFDRVCMRNCPNAEDRETFYIIFNGKNDWKQMYVDLLNAYQVKGLEIGHIKSYAQWCRLVGVSGIFLVRAFPKLTGGAPKIQSSQELRSLLRQGEWTKYRSTFATIVPFTKKMIEDMPEEFRVIFSTATLRKIDQAIENPGDEVYFRRIPTIVFAYAYVWNNVTDQDVGGLWSGKRAYDDLSLSNRNSIRNILNIAYKKIKEWEAGVMGTYNINTLPANLKNI